MSRIVRNRIRCKKCNTILESRHRHDFVSCPCGTFTDGGLDYVRWGADSFDDIEDLCEFEEDLPEPCISHYGLLLDQTEEPKILGGKLDR
jgi:hypothetical protein